MTGNKLTKIGLNSFIFGLSLFLILIGDNAKNNILFQERLWQRFGTKFMYQFFFKCVNGIIFVLKQIVFSIVDHRLKFYKFSIFGL